MVGLVKKLIEDGIESGKIKSYKVLEYSGDLFSLNDLYSSGHWRTRSNLKKKYREIFSDLIDDCDVQNINGKFSLIIFYNSRHDPDNITGMEKMFTDVLNNKGVISNDSKSFYKMFCVVPDSTLPSNTLNFYLINNGD